MSKVDKHINDIIKNIKDDREITKELLDDAIKYLAKDESRHRDIGLVMAKYVETLQRSNEQLVKVATLLSKKEQSDGLSKSELADIYDAISKDGDDK